MTIITITKTKTIIITITITILITAPATRSMTHTQTRTVRSRRFPRRGNAPHPNNTLVTHSYIDLRSFVHIHIRPFACLSDAGPPPKKKVCKVTRAEARKLFFESTKHSPAVVIDLDFDEFMSEKVQSYHNYLLLWQYIICTLNQ